ncbi:MAG: RyR domain-containing protein [Rhodothermales bacterium]|nr:RyR domain-containing protein [Rhodothermales bacterium]
MSTQELEHIATVAHEAMRAWQRVNGQPVSPAWEDATWERESTTEAVRLALHDPTPGRQHERWRAERLAQGWTYGPVKDVAAKTNPALVPFDELPPVEIAKDHLIIAITQALAPAYER